MKKTMRMLLALAFVAALILLCGAALAEEEITVVASGTCGTNLTWQLDSAGELTISGTGEMEDYSKPWTSNKDSISKVTIEDGVTSIGYIAFSYCSSLTSVVIPDGVTSIGSSAFDYCRSLKEVYIPSLEAWLNISFSDNRSNPMVFADKLYVGGELLTEAVIPDSVTSIGEHTFSGCSGLTSVVIPNSVTSIRWGAFSGCSSLTSVDIPDSVTSIGSYAFDSCRSLKSISIPDNVTSIGEKAFRNCNSLTNVIIPDSVTSIGDRAFYTYSTIAKLVFLGNDMPTMGSDVFRSSPTVYCYEYSDVDYWALENGYPTVYLDDMDLPMSLTLPEDCRLLVGKSMQVSAAIFPAQKDAQITWTSSDPAVVSVENGKLTALSVGTATITASFGSLSDSMVVTAYIPAESFELSDTELWLISKTSGQLSVQNILPADATASFTWKSSDTSILTVSSTGVLSAMKPGDATVTATSDNGLVQKCLVHVCYPVTAIEFEETEKEVYLDSTVQLTAKVTTRTQELVNKLVTFASSDESVATVDENGVVSGKKTGTATITASSGDVSASCTVKVRKMNRFALPAATKEIQSEAFLNSEAEYIVLPDGCEIIGSRAFAGCDKLVYIRMPDSVTVIADDAFEGCNVTFICASDNAAAAYAKSQGIEFVIDQ